MRINVFGFRVDAIPIKWALLISPLVLAAVVGLSNLGRKDSGLEKRVQAVAGIDVSGLTPRWQHRPRRREIFAENVLSRGYTLPYAMAQEALRTCEASGGQLLTSDQVAARHPGLIKHIRFDIPNCIHSIETPKPAVSMLHKEDLTVLIYAP